MVIQSVSIAGKVKEATGLKQRAYEMVFNVESLGELAQNLLFQRGEHCETGYSDGRVFSMALWNWAMVCEGRLIRKGRHVAQTNMDVLKALGPHKDGG